MHETRRIFVRRIHREIPWKVRWKVGLFTRIADVFQVRYYGRRRCVQDRHRRQKTTSFWQFHLRCGRWNNRQSKSANNKSNAKGKLTFLHRLFSRERKRKLRFVKGKIYAWSTLDKPIKPLCFRHYRFRLFSFPSQDEITTKKEKEKQYENSSNICKIF